MYLFKYKKLIKAKLKFTFTHGASRYYSVFSIIGLVCLFVFSLKKMTSMLKYVIKPQKCYGVVSRRYFITVGENSQFTGSYKICTPPT